MILGGGIILFSLWVVVACANEHIPMSTTSEIGETRAEFTLNKKDCSNEITLQRKNQEAVRDFSQFYIGCNVGMDLIIKDIDYLLNQYVPFEDLKYIDSIRLGYSAS